MTDTTIAPGDDTRKIGVLTAATIIMDERIAFTEQVLADQRAERAQYANAIQVVSIDLVETDPQPATGVDSARYTIRLASTATDAVIKQAIKLITGDLTPDEEETADV